MDRIARDGYFTPEPLAHAIAKRLAELHVEPRNILEPSSGGGAFVRAAHATWPTAEITAVDISTTAAMFAVGAFRFDTDDFLDWGNPEEPFDLILGNPPYDNAEAHVTHALDLLRPGGVLAFLLRLSFLGSEGRNRRIWASGRGSMVATVSPRPSFTGTGNDNSEYGLFIWVKDSRELSQLLPPLFWTPKRKGMVDEPKAEVA